MDTSIKLALFYLALFPFLVCSNIAIAKSKEAELQNFYQKAFGKKRKMPSQLEVMLQFSDREVARLKIYSDDHKKVTHIETTPLLIFFKNTLKPKYLEPLLVSLSKNASRTSVAYLKNAGITTQFDQANLSLNLLIPIKMRTPIELTLGRKRKAKHYPAESEMAQAATISAYTNLDAMFDYDDSTHNTKQRLKVDSALNIKGIVLESNNTWRNDRKQPWSRESTRLVIDDTSTLHRYTLGDVNTEYRNYQQGMRIAGLKIEKKTGLNPYLKTKRALDHIFTIERDSDVKIYINGFFKDKKKLDAGEYALTDLRLESGVNKVRLQIVDKDGKSSEQTFTLLQDQSALKSGVSNYAMQLGIPAYRTVEGYQYDKSAVLVSGYYKRGLSNNLTVDASFISDGKSLQVGANAVIPTAIGSFSGKVSQLQVSTDKSGYAAGIDYQYRPSSKKKKAVQLSISGDYFDENFTALNYSKKDKQLYSADNESVESRVSANIGKRLGKNINGRLNIQRETSYKNADIAYSANIGLSKSLKKGGIVSAQVRYQNNKHKEKSVNLRLNVPFDKNNKKDRRKSFTTSYNSLDERLINSFFISPKGNTGLDSVGASLSSYSGRDSHTLNANISYRGEIAELGFSQSLTKTDRGADKYKARSNAKLRTALSFADGQFAISKPIRDSFAIVKGPKNQQKGIAVMKGSASFSRSEGKELPDHYQSLIQNNIVPAVINVTSYRYNTINVDSSALPLGSDLESSEFELKAAYKQGYLLKAGGEPGVIVDATLFDLTDKPLSLKGGQLVAIKSKKKPIAFFTNRTGRIRLISVPPGKYHLELFDNKKETEQVLNIPNKIGKIHSIGKVKIDINN